MPRTGAGGLGGLTGGFDEVTGGRVASRGRSHTSHRTLLALFTTVQLLHFHSEGHTAGRGGGGARPVRCSSTDNTTITLSVCLSVRNQFGDEQEQEVPVLQGRFLLEAAVRH